MLFFSSVARNGRCDGKWRKKSIGFVGTEGSLERKRRHDRLRSVWVGRCDEKWRKKSIS
jgi:hypothetical protein